MSKTIKFGVTLPQFGATWDEVRETAVLVEELGFDSVWLSDHFFGIASEDPLEAWTEMTAVAAVTRRVELGFLVLCSGYRPPALLAKMATTLDHISNGRLVLGYGAGWYQEEFEAYGYEFPSARTRLEQMEEALEVLKRMWTEDEPTVHGLHWNVENARCLPKPTRKPHPPILIGGGGEKVLLKLVARYADIWNCMGIDHGHVRRKLGILRRLCEKAGRSFEEIEISQQTLGAVGATREEAREATQAVFDEVGFLEARKELALTGTPDEVVRRVQKNLDLGITTFMIHFGRFPRRESLELFAREVIPAFGRAR